MVDRNASRDAFQCNMGWKMGKVLASNKWLELLTPKNPHWVSLKGLTEPGRVAPVRADTARLFNSKPTCNFPVVLPGRIIAACPFPVETKRTLMPVTLRR